MVGILGMLLFAQPVAVCDSTGVDSLGAFVSSMTELAPDANPTLPPCASPLMREIFDATKGLARKHGTTKPGLFATGRNAAAPKPLREGPEIFGEMATLIAAAEKEVTLEMFVWETESEPSHTILNALKTLEANRRAAG